MHEDLWENTCNKLGLDPDKEYEAEVSSGNIYTESDKKENVEFPFGFDLKREHRYKH
jgi:hypothetical protein